VLADFVPFNVSAHIEALLFSVLEIFVLPGAGLVDTTGSKSWRWGVGDVGGDAVNMWVGRIVDVRLWHSKRPRSAVEE
jgi:hypothetical protein